MNLIYLLIIAYQFEEVDLNFLILSGSITGNESTSSVIASSIRQNGTEKLIKNPKFSVLAIQFGAMTVAKVSTPIRIPEIPCTGYLVNDKFQVRNMRQSTALRS